MFSAFNPLLESFRSEGGTASSRGSTSRFEDPATTLLFVTELTNADRRAQILLELSDRNLGWHTSLVGQGFNARTRFPRTALRTLAVDLEEQTNEPEVVVRLLRRFVARSHRDLQNGATPDELSEFGDATIGHEWGTVQTVAISPDGRYVVTGAEDGRTNIWNAESGRFVRTLSDEYRGSVVTVRVAPEGNRVLTIFSSGPAVVWDLETGRKLFDLGGDESEVVSAVFSRDGTNVVTAAGDGSVVTWDIDRSVSFSNKRQESCQSRISQFSAPSGDGKPG